MAAPAPSKREVTVEVALPVPLDQTFHYLVPPALQAEVGEGSVVVVPFGRRVLAGTVVGISPPPAGRTDLKAIRAVLAAGAAVPADVLALSRWTAEYYLAPWGLTLEAALPPGGRLRQDASVVLTDAGRTRLAAADIAPAETRILAAVSASRGLSASAIARLGEGARELIDHLVKRGWVRREARPKAQVGEGSERLVGLGPGGLAAALAACGRSQRARSLVMALEAEGEVPWAELRAATGADAAVLKRLAALGAVRVSTRAVERDPLAGETGEAYTEPTPTPEQAAALAEIDLAVTRGGFSAFLLHGITGSGKTLVYIHAMRRALAAGKGVLYLVPEIALTPLLARKLKAAFGAELAILHSGLTPGQRQDAWRRLHQGRARLAFGTRSAVWAPVRDLGLVVVDEEHDPSYKQDSAPHYHGRDVAAVRAKQAGVPLVLGSATPSLESMHNARRGRYHLLRLASRVPGSRLPTVEVLDMRAEFARAGKSVVLSARLEEELRACLGRGDQSLVLLNRRGYAAFLICRECGERGLCPRCSMALTVHRAEDRVRCHLCGYARAVPRRCGTCGGDFLQLVGLGTEQVMEIVASLLPRARLGRLDRDAVKSRADFDRVLLAFAAREIDVLVGTQMLAKGHDFPRVTLVGVVSVDAALALPDFRATERAFQLLTQVSGRAGRGENPGLVLLQTYHPGNEAVRLAALQDYDAFFERESRLRKLMGYPPHSALANIIVRSRRRATAEAVAATVAEALRRAAPAGLRLLGPALAPVERARYQWRAQVLARSTDRALLRRALLQAREAWKKPAGDAVVEVDIDPLHLL